MIEPIKKSKISIILTKLFNIVSFVGCLLALSYFLAISNYIGVMLVLILMLLSSLLSKLDIMLGYFDLHTRYLDILTKYSKMNSDSLFEIEKIITLRQHWNHPEFESLMKDVLQKLDTDPLDLGLPDYTKN